MSSRGDETHPDNDDPLRDVDYRLDSCYDDAMNDSSGHSRGGVDCGYSHVDGGPPAPSGGVGHSALDYGCVCGRTDGSLDCDSFDDQNGAFLGYDAVQSDGFPGYGADQNDACLDCGVDRNGAFRDSCSGEQEPREEEATYPPWVVEKTEKRDAGRASGAVDDHESGPGSVGRVAGAIERVVDEEGAVSRRHPRDGPLPSHPHRH